jgi:hypothetical protein
MDSIHSLQNSTRYISRQLGIVQWIRELLAVGEHPP